ncbi:hypothetical protein D3C84_720500 [compost metagenome]
MFECKLDGGISTLFGKLYVLAKLSEYRRSRQGEGQAERVANLIGQSKGIPAARACLIGETQEPKAPGRMCQGVARVYAVGNGMYAMTLRVVEGTHPLLVFKGIA